VESEFFCVATFFQSYDLQTFPFDKHELTFEVRSSDYGADKVMLVQYREKDPTKFRNSVLEAFTLPAWSLHEQPAVAGTLVTKQPAGSASAQKYSYYYWTVKTDRHYVSYLWNIAFIMYLVSTLSVIVFFLSSDDVGSRSSTMLTLVLTAVALKFVTNDNLPKISYLTYIDYYIFFCFFVLYTISILSAVATHFTKVGPATLWNQWFCYAFLIMWLVVHVLALIIVTVKYSGPPSGTADEAEYGCCWRNRLMDGSPSCCVATPLQYACCVRVLPKKNESDKPEFHYRWVFPRVETVIFSVVMSALLILIVSFADLEI